MENKLEGQSKAQVIDDTCFQTPCPGVYAPILAAIVLDDYESIRKMTGYLNESPEQLLYKLSKDVADRNYRRQHNISERVGVLIDLKCHRKLCQMGSDLSDEVYYTSEFDLPLSHPWK